MLRTLLVTISPIIGGYLLAKIDPVESLFSSYITSQLQLQVLLSSFLLLCFLVPYKYHIKKIQSSPKKTIKPIKLTTNHKNILYQFKINNGEILSSESLEYLTGIDSFNVHLVLDELLSHDLIYATNLDETKGWLHVLSESGRKFIAKNLT